MGIDKRATDAPVDTSTGTGRSRGRFHPFIGHEGP